MKIHGLMMVRDEDDILEQHFNASLEWIDGIYIYDTGSTDQTWDIIQEFARRDERIIPVRRESVGYNEGMRSILFDRARHVAEDGDWFVRLDADEFYEISPHEFLTRMIRPFETNVYLQWYFFRLTSREVRAWETGEENLGDRRRSIIDRRRYFTIPTYAEPRFFRYRKTMQWPPSISFPFNAGYVAINRIPIRHYPHRDPIQLEKRMRLRARVFKMGKDSSSFNHWKHEDWRRYVVALPDADPTSVVVPPGDVHGLDEGQLHYASPGSSLPTVLHLNHLPSVHKRLAQRLAHRFLLPVLDARRPAYGDVAQTRESIPVDPPSR